MGTIGGTYDTGYTLYGAWLGAYATPGGDGYQILNGAQFTVYGTATVTGGQSATVGSSGGIGIYLNGGVHTPTLINRGTIYGGSGGVGGSGVALHGGMLINNGSIVGGNTASAGVTLNGGTLINAGKIRGSGLFAASAVQFGAAAGTLIVDPGAVFYGYVTANAAVNDTLQLTGTESSEGTPIYIGEGGPVNFTGFQTLDFGAGSAWTVDVGFATEPLTLDGFAASDKIGITFQSPLQVAKEFGVSYTALGGGAFEFEGSAGGETLTSATYGTLHFSGDFSGDTFLLKPVGASETAITVQPVCFLRGTRIRMVAGDKAVENLRIGEAVLTASGEARPIRWIGSRGLDCSCHPKPGFVWPIRIEAGAFAARVPVRDLWVSPFHALLVEGFLVQAEKLLNGATIVQVPRERVEYWHVELDGHDILLAEGLPAESYLDVGNRSAFVNGAASLDAHPDFAPKHGGATCAAPAHEGPVVARAKAALLARAVELGYARTEDPDLHILADGQRFDPVRLSEQRVAFLLPAARTTIELRCRCFTPAQIDPANDDTRSLGICVNRLQRDGEDVDLGEDGAFAAGWHPLERSFSPRGEPWRWSRDRARLAAGTRLLVMDLCHQGRHYWTKPRNAGAAVFG